MMKVSSAIAMILSITVLSAADLMLFTGDTVNKSNCISNAKQEVVKVEDKNCVKITFGGVTKETIGTFQTFLLPTVEKPADYDALKLTLSGNSDDVIVLVSTAEKPYCYKSRMWDGNATLKLKGKGIVTVVLPFADFVHPYKNEELPKLDPAAIKNISLSILGTKKLAADAPGAEVVLQEIALTKVQ